ncbi:MAG: hypothetical protein NTX25_18940 [Proteobacteria bacterium]|nr:hypothetical protein [Pseudomonadota bacterium]
MKKAISPIFALVFILISGCGKHKTQEGQAESGAANPATFGEEKPKDKPADANAIPAEPAKPIPKPSLELYPPITRVFPYSIPDSGRPLYFGFAADGTRPFQMVWGYAVAVFPDFEHALTEPSFNSEEEFVAFMNDWAKQFQANQKYVDGFNQAASTFAWKVDPNFFNNEAVTLPENLFDGAPAYVKVTQKVFARRFTTKAVGMTAITGSFEGATASIPVQIQAYTNAQLLAGKTRYESPTDGCVGCHGSPTTSRDAFLKHSSDYLAFSSDTEILTLIKTATYPDGTRLNSGTHKFTFATAEEESSIVAYLRSFPPSFDKIQSSTNAMAGFTGLNSFR